MTVWSLDDELYATSIVRHSAPRLDDVSRGQYKFETESDATSISCIISVCRRILLLPRNWWSKSRSEDLRQNRSLDRPLPRHRTHTGHCRIVNKLAELGRITSRYLIGNFHDKQNKSDRLVPGAPCNQMVSLTEHQHPRFVELFVARLFYFSSQSQPMKGLHKVVGSLNIRAQSPYFTAANQSQTITFREFADFQRIRRPCLRACVWWCTCRCVCI